MMRHAMRNALIPVITLIGLDFGTVIGAAVLTETVFDWPGLGSEIANSVVDRDLPVILGLTLVVVISFAIINRVFPREQRVSSNAYFRAARNVGYTLGALVAGLALATNSDDVVRLVPVVTAVLLLANATLVSRLPRTTEHAEEEQALEAAMRDHGKRSALRNRGFVLMSICGGVLSTHQVLLNVVKREQGY